MKNFTFLKTTRAFLMLFCLLAAGSLQAKIIYVNGSNPSEDRDGASWATAFRTLETALSRAVAGDEIWVAKGRYQPVTSGTYYSLVSGVAVYGGFAGTETSLDQRNWKTNVTILQGNNSSVIHNSDLNNQTILDGFTVTYGNAPGYGGGMFNTNVSIQVRNCVFSHNHTLKKGGAVYNYNSSPTFTNVVFFDNFYDDEDGEGGGIYNEAGSSVTFTNVVFYLNGLGAIYNDGSKCTVTNGNFLENAQYLPAGVGAVTNHAASGNTATLTIKNSIFSSSQFTPSESIVTDGSGAVTIVTYSAIQDAIDGEGNIQAPYENVLYDSLSMGIQIEGRDGIWMTSDDLLYPSPCGGFSIIDHGTNTGVTATTDIAGLPRRTDVPLIADGGQGAAPIVDMGAYESQSTLTSATFAGSIKNAHTIPYPQEDFSDSVLSASLPAADVNDLSITWQKNENNGSGWVDVTPQITNSKNLVSYHIPELTTTTDYRRGIINYFGCAVTYYSNVVTIKVVEPNGAISGKVISKAGVPVKGITIQVIRIDSVSGGPAGHIDSTITGDDGTYSISPIYYGDPGLSSSKASFYVKPVKEGHGFNYSSITKTLSKLIPQLTEVNFTDTTVFSLTGTVYQRCTSCNYLVDKTKRCEEDSVSIRRDGTVYTQTTLINGSHGSYALSISDPGSYRIKPDYKSHLFAPSDSLVSVQDNVSHVDFDDTTYHTISGTVLAGCSQYIGRATLEFTDILPDDINGARTSCFTAKITTDIDSGYYSIRLPARKYKVRVIDFIPKTGTDVSQPAFLDFFAKVAADSLTRDIATHDTTLNLAYQRPPVLLLSGLDSLKCKGGSKQDFALIPQGVQDSFVVTVYQGDPKKYFCPVSDTLKPITIVSTVQNNGTQEFLYSKPVDTGVIVRLEGGIPNIIADQHYYRSVDVYYTDRYGAAATFLHRNVLVTGAKADTATFITVSPEVPLMILHDPLGDNSSSYWRTGITYETALRMSEGSSIGGGVWGEVKVGVDFEAGIGISTETKLWGSIKGSVDVEATNTSTNEAIITTTITQDIATSDNPDVTGDDGDVFIGSAMNLVYAGATIISYNADNCEVSSDRKLIVDNKGFATQYIYTAEHIRNSVIPSLQMLADASNTTDSAGKAYLNQINVWQQVLTNNEKNKANAVFDKNISFDGGVGAVTNSLSTSTTQSNEIVFDLTIDAGLAVELGFEQGGSGVSGGASVNFRMQTGKSETNTFTKETETGYTLDDDDNGDYFSVDVFKDPVYSSPVFKLKAGTASCPAEPGTQPRDEATISVTNPIVDNVPAANAAIFNMKLANSSQSRETRIYDFSLDPASNTDGAIVTINGIQVSNVPIPFTIPFGKSQTITVAVRKDASSTQFSYTGLTFQVTDNCGGDIMDTKAISAYFISPCSNVTLAQPANNYVLTIKDNNVMSVLIKDYTISSLTDVTLEYAPVGSAYWEEGFTRTAGQLDNNSSGTLVKWNVENLDDGNYNIRLRLNCAGGIVYSNVSTVLFDRKYPVVFGKPEPTDDNYVNGDVISFSYDENINVNNLSSIIEMTKLSDKSNVPFTISGYGNKFIIVPSSNLLNYAGDSIRVVVKGIKDIYGNENPVPDTVRFTIGNTIIATGAKALYLTIENAVVSNTSDIPIKFLFNLPQPASQKTIINYTIGGTAVLHTDFDTAFVSVQSPLNTFDGLNGTIIIDSGKTSAALYIIPVKGLESSLGKTIIINVSSGGGYELGNITSQTGMISNVLPVTLVSFSAKLVDGKTNLQWQTANETNTSYFIVERSTDGIHFSQVGKTGAKGSGSNRYAATDASLVSGNNYYRLKTVDKDGRYLYSNTLLITYTVSGLHIVNVSPSPVTGTKATVNIASDKTLNLKLIVLDVVGRQMNITPVAVQTGMNHAPVSFPSLSSGMYFLYAVDNSGRKSNVVQFVKQ